LAFLKNKYRTYPTLYPNEVRVFQEFMSEAGFKEWYSDVPQYQFEIGQEPNSSNFTSAKKTNLKDK
jgi:hypothetical protein